MEPLEPNPVAVRKAAVLIVLVGLGAWMNSFAGAFLFDDLTNIVNNRQIRQLPGFDRLSMRFLIQFTNAVNYWLDALNPWGYHAVNLAIHVGASLALFGLIRRTLLLPRWTTAIRNRATWLAAAIALLWEVHPLQTEAVTYLIQRCESMMGLFYLLTLYCFVRGATSPTPRWWYLASAVSVILGLGCKEVIATAPLIVVLYDRVFLSETWRQLIARRWKFDLTLAALTVGFFAIVYGSNLSAGEQGTAGFDYAQVGPWAYLLTESEVLLHYLWLCVWPFNQSFDYMGWPVATSWKEVALPGIVVCLAVAASIIGVYRRTWWGFAGMWFFVILGPTSSIMPIQDVCVEHRMYLPLAAVLALLVGFVDWSIGQLCRRGPRSIGLASTVRAGLAAGVIATLGLVTLLRNEYYRAPLVMWNDVASKRPGDFRAFSDTSKYRYDEEEGQDAVDFARKVVETFPNYYEVQNQWGIIMLDQDNLPEAIRRFEICHQSAPHVVSLARNLGLALLIDRRYRDAIAMLKKALEINPNDSLTWVLLTAAYVETNQPAEARAAGAKAVRNERSIARKCLYQARRFAFADNPNSTQKRQAAIYAEAGSAITEEESPDQLDVLAFAYSLSGDFDRAQATLRKAIALAEGDDNRLARLRNRLKIYSEKRTLRPGDSG